MKKTLVLMCFLVAFCGVRAWGQDFTLVNKTGFGIYAVFIAPHGSDDWEEDLLGCAALFNGDYAGIKYERTDKLKYWDLKLDDKDGNHFVWENIDLRAISKIVVSYKDQKPTFVSE